MKALVIDDSALMRRIVGKALREAGLQVEAIVEAANGVEGIAALERETGRIDCILCDLHMPVMDGVGFLRERAARGLGDAPVVMVTADAGDPLVQQALEAGAGGFILKPFSPEQVRQRLLAMMETA